MLAIHDEIRFLVEEKDQYKFSLLLQIANLWTRGLFASRLNFQNLPLSVGFFSSIDIDHCLRKEVDMECLTPSNQIPIPFGNTCNIFETLQKIERFEPEFLLSLQDDDQSINNNDSNQIQKHYHWFIKENYYSKYQSNPQWRQIQTASTREEIQKIIRKSRNM